MVREVVYASIDLHLVLCLFLGWPEGQPKDLLMGAGLQQKEGARGLTFSCAACHAGSFFGSSILGLSARHPRANEVFAMGKQIASVGHLIAYLKTL